MAKNDQEHVLAKCEDCIRNGRDLAYVERHPWALQQYMEALAGRISAIFPWHEMTSHTGFCGASESDRTLASALAAYYWLQFIYPDTTRYVIPISNKGGGFTETEFERHKPEAGDRWWVVQKIFDPKTANEIVKLIENCGASVIGIACLHNPSSEMDTELVVRPDFALKIIALTRPTPRIAIAA